MKGEMICGRYHLGHGSGICSRHTDNLYKRKNIPCAYKNASSADFEQCLSCGGAVSDKPCRPSYQRVHRHQPRVGSRGGYTGHTRAVCPYAAADILLI